MLEEGFFMYPDVAVKKPIIYPDTSGQIHNNVYIKKDVEEQIQICILIPVANSTAG
jgi:hypothetical protein